MPNDPVDEVSAEYIAIRDAILCKACMEFGALLNAAVDACLDTEEYIARIHALHDAYVVRLVKKGKGDV
jgi:hypothetical protein